MVKTVIMFIVAITMALSVNAEVVNIYIKAQKQVIKDESGTRMEYVIAGKEYQNLPRVGIIPPDDAVHIALNSQEDKDEIDALSKDPGFLGYTLSDVALKDRNAFMLIKEVSIMQDNGEGKQVVTRVKAKTWEDLGKPEIVGRSSDHKYSGVDNDDSTFELK